MPRALNTRGAVKLARSEGKRTRQSIRDDCKRERHRLTEDARERREKLRAAIRNERDALRGSCSVRLADARAATDRAIEEARKSAMHLRQLRDVARSPAQKHAAERARFALATRIAESDDEVRRNLESPDLRRVWDNVKHLPALRKLKQGLSTRTERFLDWVHDHSDAVARILAAEQPSRWGEESEDEYRERTSSRAPRPPVTLAESEIPF